MVDEAGYKYDIFISYRNKSRVRDWILKRFAPILQEALEGEMQADWYGSNKNKCIFIDSEDIQEGTYWKTKLSDTVKRSRIMIAVLTPEYFNSDWCMSEWKSFEKRCDAFRNELSLEDSQSLIFTVTYSDGKHFPQYAKEIQSHQDYRDYTSLLPAFNNTQRALDFEDAVKSFAKTLSKVLEKIIIWNENFPIEEYLNLPPEKSNSNPTI